MFDIGWSELLVIGVVALVVIGPKDLPRVLKTVGFYVRKARAVSREFQSSVEQMVREAELEDVKKEIEKVGSLDLKSEFEKSIDPTGDMKKSLEAPLVPTVDPFGETPPTTAAPAPLEAPISTPEAPAALPPAEAPSAEPKPSSEQGAQQGPAPGSNFNPPEPRTGTTG
jgi:sec-independent protein translocase protein TatB